MIVLKTKPRLNLRDTTREFAVAPKLEKKIFKKGSTTFFLASKLFPQNVRRDVYDLYSFVRVADDYVDILPQDRKAFRRLRSDYDHAIKNTQFDTTKTVEDSVNERVVKNIVRLSHKHNFPPAWVEVFLEAMESDLDWQNDIMSSTRMGSIKNEKRQAAAKFKTKKDLLSYIHGSAEVIGLMMSRIMGLPRSADKYAMLQGRSLQMINFIRDIEEDVNLGRCYFSSTNLKQFSIKTIAKQNTQEDKQAFEVFVRAQIADYRNLQQEANQGLKYIPRRLRIPIKTAIDLYAWVALEIEKNPLIIFERKVKPSKLRILKTVLSNIFST